ncbi:DUF397 domain-containing protein [Streptomyces aquilus]|uniref:DUF397 domain-containing protein n=1 Tax=Streptomyces aquilus TaxID=2548456 RepID=UPI0036993167
MSDQLKWFKSSYSDNEGGDCVEVAFATAIHVRDSKLPFGATVQLPAPVNITLETEPLEEFAD